MKRKGFILLMIILFSGFSIVEITSSNNDVVTNIRKINQKFALTPHGPISIVGDGGFASYSFPGSGLESDPYLIDSLEINTGDSFGIFISNTSKHFKIINCYVSANEVSIYLNDTAEGTAHVLDSTMQGGFDRGLRLWKSPGGEVKNNIFSLNGYGGLHCAGSPNSFIMDNQFFNNEVALYLGGCNFTQIRNNTMIDNAYDGIWCKNSYYLSIVENTIINNNRFGIYFYEYCSNSFVRGNILYSNEIGIFMATSDSCRIYNNTIESNHAWGIYASQSSSCEIDYNTIENNFMYGIELVATVSNMKIHHNNFIDNAAGAASQAFDSGSNNFWYDSSVNEGNYWNDLGGAGTYALDGTAGSIDLYPLSSPAVYIDEFPPVIEGDDDLIITEGTLGIVLNWTVHDDNPANYSIYKDGILVSSGNWVDGQLITVSIDGLSVGIFEYTLIAEDDVGNSSSDTIEVSVTALQKTSFLYLFMLLGLTSLGFLINKKRT